MMALYYSVVLLGLSVSCLGSEGPTTVVLNDAIDQLLEGIRMEINAQGKDVMQVPDAHNEWRWKKGFISLSGEITCTGGQAGHLATLYRTGDVTMTTESSTISLRMKLGLRDLFLKFDRCESRVSRLPSFSNRIEASLDSNSIDAQVTLIHAPDGTCSARLDHIFMDNMGHVNVKIGNSVFQKVINKLLELLANHFKSNIQDSINKSLEKSARDQLPNANLCEQIPH